MTYDGLMGTLNPTRSLTQSLTHSLCLKHKAMATSVQHYLCRNCALIGPRLMYCTVVNRDHFYAASKQKNQTRV